MEDSVKLEAEKVGKPSVSHWSEIMYLGLLEKFRLGLNSFQDMSKMDFQRIWKN